MKQESREWAWSLLFWSSWAGACLIATLRVTNTLPQEWGAATIVLIGTAIFSAIRLSRMKLTATMIAVFEAGAMAAQVQQDETEQRIKASIRKGSEDSG